MGNSSSKKSSKHTARGVKGDAQPAPPRKEAEKREEPSFPIRSTAPIKRQHMMGGGD